MKEKSIHFDIQMTFDDETIRRMFRAEYYTYETVQRCLRFFLGGVGILVSFFAPVPTAAKAIFLMFGVWLLVAGDFPSKVQAEGVISKRGGKSSQVRYQLKEEGIQIKGSGFVCYKNLNRLVYDDEYLYLFLNRQNAIMLPIHAVGAERLESVKKKFRKRAKEVLKDCKNPEEYAIGSWWGGSGAFWDFTKPKAREAWKNYLIENLVAVGTNSIWNDNCEYDSILDKDAVVDFDGKGGTIGQLKPLMSTLMCKLSNDAVKEHDPNLRPYSVCRSGSSGIQHYAQTWCGDNYTSWNTLKYNIPMITGMGLSGQPNEGADIGGFSGPAPEEELFVRWVQQGIFQARFSIHSASNDNTVTEPWMFENSKEIIRSAILLRYRMEPYIYSGLYEAAQTGAPIMRALVYEFQDDEDTYDNSFDFMFGRSLLVANVIEKGAVSRRVYLPRGCRWFDMNDNYRCYDGGQTIEIPVTMESIPMFLREGGIMVLADNQLMNMEQDHVRDLHLIIAPTAQGSRFVMYEDDGRTNDFKKGVFRKTLMEVSGTDVVNVAFTSEGSYQDTVETVFVEMIRKDRSPFWVKLDGQKLEHYLNRRKFEAAECGWYYSQTKRTVLVKYKNPGRDAVLTVSFEDFDLIGM